MGKRTTAPARPRDYWPTPIEPIKPLIPYIIGSSYAEPCVGGGDLVSGINYLTFRLSNRPRCLWASDLQPDTPNLERNVPSLSVRTRNAFNVTPNDLFGIDLIITNPPFSWKVLSKLLPIWLDLKPTWLLLPADMANNVRFSTFMQHCSDIVPVGRVSWMGNGESGMENFSWYCFDAAWDAGFARQRPR